MSEKEIREQIANLLDGQLLAVLATQRQGQPYASLIAFAHADDLASLVFATPNTTRKFANLMADPRVSLLVDNRGNTGDDFQRASAVTIVGEAHQMNKEESSRYKSLYLKRHPHLEKFFNATTTAFIKVSVKHYILVSQFQQVMALHLADEKQIRKEDAQ